MRLIGIYAVLAFVCLSLALACPTLNITSPANYSVLSNTSITHIWQNISTPVYNATYGLCYNSSSKFATVCYENITYDEYNLTFDVDNGSFVSWTVYAYCNFSNYSANSSPYSYFVGINASMPIYQQYNYDIESLIYSYWVLWGRWIMLIFVCGIAYMTMSIFSSMAFSVGAGIIAIGMLGSDTILIGLGAGFIVLGLVLKMANR